MKYIIKNCPCFVEGIMQKGHEKIEKGCNYYKLKNLIKCQDYSNCLLKNIVEKTKKYIDDEADFSPKELLSMLDIQEVEE